MSVKPESIEAESYATMFILARAKQLLALRKMRAAIEALEEDACNDLRFELFQRERISCTFPALKIELRLRRETLCSCCEKYVWDCEHARDGQAITVREVEVPRYVHIEEKTLPVGALRPVRDKETQ